MAKQLFILSGQSNMAGRGGVHHKRWDGVVPPECHPNPSILRFSSASKWEKARDPLHADIDTAKVCGVCPGMPFANALLPRLLGDAAVIGLVPCAVGGTAIKEWDRGCRLYEDMIRRAKEAAEGCADGEIKAVLWYQGESDTNSARDAEVYGAKLERLIEDVRSDLKLPSLPFIQVALASGNKNHIEKVREAQLGLMMPNVCIDAKGTSLNADHLHLTTESLKSCWVALASGDKQRIEKVREAQLGLKMPNVFCVDAKGLPLNADNLHLSTEAQVLLGKMLADAYVDNYLTSAAS